MRWFLLIMVAVMCFGEDEFQTDRLPIGDPAKKLSLCKVTLDSIYDTDQEKDVSLQEALDILKQKRIVLIGESHTNQTHHDVQFEIIKGLYQAGRPVVLALEMFNPNQDQALAEWSTGKTDPDTFLEQTDFLVTWSHNYRYYKPIFDFVRENHIPVYGANIERKYAHEIGKKGIAGLTEEERKAIPDVDTKNGEHRFYIQMALQGMSAVMPQVFPTIYEAQCLWDTVMGEGAIRAAKQHPDATVVVLAGSGHVDYNLGIGRIIQARSDLPFASVITVDIEDEPGESGMTMAKKHDQKDKTAEQKTDGEEKDKKRPASMAAHGMGMMGEQKPYRIVSRSLANFLWGKKAESQERYPAFGFSFEDDTENGYVLKRVLPNTQAFEQGFEKGDQIMTMDGKTFATLFQLKKYLHFKNWGETLQVGIKRGDEEKDIKFEIQPLD